MITRVFSRVSIAAAAMNCHRAGLGVVGGGIRRAFLNKSDKSTKVRNDEKYIFTKIENPLKFGAEKQTFNYAKLRKKLQKPVYDSESEVLSIKLRRKVLESSLSKSDSKLVVEDIKAYLSNAESIERNRDSFTSILTTLMNFEFAMVNRKRKLSEAGDSFEDFYSQAVKMYLAAGVSKVYDLG